MTDNTPDHPVVPEKSSVTPGKRNIPEILDLPIATRTANLRHGPDLHSELLALLPLIGVWRGEGQTVREIDGQSQEYAFGQQIIISHSGENYLHWESVIWEIPPAEGIEAPIITQELGFLRISEKDDIELLLTHSDGFIEIYYGSPLTNTSWEFVTDVVIQAGSAKPIGGSKRLYGIINGNLAYVEERINTHGKLVPRFSAQLYRWAG